MRFANTLLALGAAVATTSRLTINVAAQSTALPDPSASIPTNASADCISFLNSLNSDPDLEACTDPLAQVVNNYTQATSQKGATPASDANALTTALNAMCSNNLGCQTGVIKGKVYSFGRSCNADLVNQNDAVVNLYDRLYLIVPFQQALCSKDKSGAYCVTSLASSGKVSDSTPQRRALARRDPMRVIHEALQDIAARYIAPEPVLEGGMQLKRQSVPVASNESTSGIKDSNLPFLFIKPDSAKDVLCGECAQKIMAAYINFETSSPYAIGLKNSDVLSSQSDLYKAAKKTCGNDWATQVNKLANTSAFAEVSAAPKALAGPANTLFASVVALAVAGVAVLL